MRIGCCISDLEQLPVLQAAGADQCELQVVRLAAASDSDFEHLARALSESAVQAHACNVLLPGELAVVGDSVDEARIAAYLERAMPRLQRLGVRLVVVGSGRSRTVPAGFDHRRALDQFESFLRRAAGIAGGHGVVLALEPLRRAETNLINRVTEGQAFLCERGLDQVQLLADLYHMREEGEPLEVVAGCAHLLAHVHVAGAGRRPPGPADADLAELVARLQAAGYDAGCSVECRWSDFASEAPDALAHLRRLAETKEASSPLSPRRARHASLLRGTLPHEGGVRKL
jgi:sugar phosphate isomerase/epimerase